jgi:hypothetical protein
MSHRATAPKGAMTHAMNAARDRTAATALRVGVLVGTRLVEERVFRGDARISLGRTERATLVVDDPAAPQHLELFVLRGGVRTLTVDPQLRGRVSDGETVRAVESFGAGATVALDPRWRGRLSIGDVTLLFQFVAAQTAAPRAQLPVSIRQRPLREVDWTWNSCAAAFLAIAVAGAAYAEHVYDPVVDDDVDDVRRFVRLMAEPSAPESTPAPSSTESAQGAAAAERPTTSARPSPAPDRRAGGATPRPDNARDIARAAASADRAAAAAISEFQRATFGALTGALDRGAGSARDQLAQGAVQQATLEDLQRTGGVTTASRTGIGRQTSDGPGNDRGLCGPDCLANRAVVRTSPELTSGVAPRERRIAPIEVPTEQPLDGEGEVDAGAVASRIRAQIGGIRSCYERALRDNPALAGRVEVRFTLGETGRITRITPSGLAEAPEVGACISQRLRGLAFPAPRGGSVDFMFPFVLDHQ